MYVFACMRCMRCTQEHHRCRNHDNLHGRPFFVRVCFLCFEFIRDLRHLSYLPALLGRATLPFPVSLLQVRLIKRESTGPGGGDDDVDDVGESELTPYLLSQLNSWAGAGAGSLIRGAAGLCPPQREATEGTAIQTAA